MTLGELKKRIKELEIDNPELSDDTSLMIFHQRNWVPLIVILLFLRDDEPTLVVST